MDLIRNNEYKLIHDYSGFSKGDTFVFKGVRGGIDYVFEHHAGLGSIYTIGPDVHFEVIQSTPISHSTLVAAGFPIPKGNWTDPVIAIPLGPRVGDKLVLKKHDPYSYFKKGDVFIVTNELPDQWMVRTSRMDLHWKDITVSKIDVWNWFSAWPGSDDGSEPAMVHKKRCEHKVVNVSFNGLEMRCKFCDKSEDEVKAEQRCEDTGGY